MQARAEIGAKAEIAFVSGAALGEAVESGKAGPDAARFVCTCGELPAGDDLIADIFVDFSASFQNGQRQVGNEAIEKR